MLRGKQREKAVKERQVMLHGVREACNVVQISVCSHGRDWEECRSCTLSRGA
jgi:hypothetical protein